MSRSKRDQRGRFYNRNKIDNCGWGCDCCTPPGRKRLPRRAKIKMRFRDARKIEADR